MNKVLTDNEKNYVKTFKEKTERVAGIFCAKEAVKKASGIAEKLSFLNIEILHKPNGAPYAVFLGEEFEALNNKQTSISISHSKTVSVAVCVII